MMEHVKSVMLTLLVLLSLLQSYLLSFNSPQYEPLNQNDYVQAELFGTQSELDKLVFPQQIVIHSGEQRHTVLYPNDQDYNLIFDSLKQTTYDGVRRVLLSLTPINWDDLRNLRESLEIRFQYAVPVNVLQSIFSIKGDLVLDGEMITGLWIAVKENHEEVATYFQTSGGGIVYEATKTNINVSDVERFVKLAENHPAYHTVNGDYYLPNEPLKASAYEIPYTQYSAEQLKKSLFVDPGLTRNLTERDGSEIYTDGKRGLQIKNEQHWMNYSDPAAPVDNRPDLKDYLLSAIQFINQHGGWNFTYLLGPIPQKSTADAGAGQTFVFRQYYDSFPVVQEPYYAQIQVLLRRGIISNYERTIIVPNRKEATREDVTLVGGQELDSLVEAAGKRKAIASVYPAYRSEVSDDSISLTPAWVVLYRDGKNEYLDQSYTDTGVE